MLVGLYHKINSLHLLSSSRVTENEALAMIAMPEIVNLAIEKE
jgi:hypothetical protein